MRYGYILGFMYDVGIGVGEFLEDEERAGFEPMALAEIVREYVTSKGVLSSVFLKWQIARYIRHNMTPEGLTYEDDPFHQDLCFPEIYFDGDLLVFLNNVISLLEGEIRSRFKKIFVRE
jgi:hypothetical protein